MLIEPRGFVAYVEPLDPNVDLALILACSACCFLTKNIGQHMFGAQNKW